MPADYKEQLLGGEEGQRTMALFLDFPLYDPLLDIAFDLQDSTAVQQQHNRSTQPRQVQQRQFPLIDVREDKESIHVVAELPGIAKEDIHVEFDDKNNLVISGKREKPVVGEGVKTRLQERPTGQFNRRVLLTGVGDVEQTKTKFEHGLLELDIPKHPANQRKTIKL